MSSRVKGSRIRWSLAGLLLVLGGLSPAWAQNTFPQTGNAGIGTMNPVDMLDIKSVGAGFGLRLLGTNSGGSAIAGIRQSTGGGGRLFLRDSSGATDVIQINVEGDSYFNNGNVGVGTANPQAQFHISGTAPHIILSDTNEGAGNQNWRIRTGSIALGDLQIQTLDDNFGTPTTIMAFHRGGNIGIGTGNPQAQFHISGTAPHIILSDTNEGAGNQNWRIRTGSTALGDLQIQTLDDNFGTPTTIMAFHRGGNIGIGTGNPQTRLHVAGDVQVDGNIGAKYQDVAEWVKAMGRLSEGTVVVIDPRETNRVASATEAYDTRVAGVVSTKPGVLLGEGGEGKAKVAHSGRVKVKVDASYAPIAVGDLLVTSPTSGYAMRSEPVNIGGGIALHRPGTLIGKALEALSVGRGEILVLLTLQ